jgi:multicomponent Na+:H+ antiporter subunit D
MNPIGALTGIPWMVWVIVLPLMASMLVFLRGRAGAAVIGIGASGGIALAVAGLLVQVWRLGPQQYRVGGWGAPLGIELYADGLSAVMLAMTALVAVPVAVYVRTYFAIASEAESAAGMDRERHFWVLWLLLWGAMNALYLSADMFNLYVALELITLSAVSLVALGGRNALPSAMRYLLAAVLGSMLYLLSVAVLYWSQGTLDVPSLGRALTPGWPATAAITLATLGLFLKTALFPFHFWLPSAHMNAPVPASAILSGLVVKASYYLLLRLWLDVFRDAVSFEAGALLGLLGAGAIVWGSLQAMVASRLKLLIAYSTVAQLGYLFLVFPLVLSAGANAAAWQGAILYGVSHACAKAALFMAAGTILHALGHDRVADLAGLADRLPASLLTIGFSSVALMGLPPSGGFVAKWLLLDAALTTGQTSLAVVIVTGGLLAAAYMFRVLGPAMAASRSEAAVRRVPASMRWAPMALALVSLLLGFAASPVLALLDVGVPVVDRSVVDPVP